jgi:hypothetical protein
MEIKPASYLTTYRVSGGVRHSCFFVKLFVEHRRYEYNHIQPYRQNISLQRWKQGAGKFNFLVVFHPAVGILFGHLIAAVLELT